MEREGLDHVVLDRGDEGFAFLPNDSEKAAKRNVNRTRDNI